MHLVSVTSPLTSGAYKLPVGNYLADNVNAVEILTRQHFPASGPCAKSGKCDALLELARIVGEPLHTTT